MIWIAAAFAQESFEDYRSHVDQARFFVRKGWYEDAAAELEAALASENGELDGRAWYLLAEIRYHLGDLQGAMYAADRAHSNADTDEDLELAAGFDAWLRENFGLLALRTHFDGVQTTVDLELVSLVLDPELKRYVQQLDTRLSKRRPLPVTIGLPAGTYRVNGREVTVAANATQRVRIPVRGATPEPLQVTELEVSAGVAAWFGPALDGHFPGPHLRAGLTQPLGRFVTGLSVDGSMRPIQTVESVRAGLGDLGVAARFGVEAARVRDAALRGALSGRIASVRGLGLPCGPGPPHPCARDAEAVVWAYPSGLGAFGGVELSAIVLDRRRRTAIGWGVRVIAEAGAGRRPAEGSARMAGDGVEFTVAGSDRSFVAGGVRLLATGVWAR